MFTRVAPIFVPSVRFPLDKGNADSRDETGITRATQAQLLQNRSFRYENERACISFASRVNVVTQRVNRDSSAEKRFKCACVYCNIWVCVTCEHSLRLFRMCKPASFTICQQKPEFSVGKLIVKAHSVRKFSRWKSSHVFLFFLSNRNDRKIPEPFFKAILARPVFARFDGRPRFSGIPPFRQVFSWKW